ncbi:MAG: NAD(P)(+) transhydrogenase (Re/Si-specific) subunit beta [Granulosicoccus sp.]
MERPLTPLYPIVVLPLPPNPINTGQGCPRTHRQFGIAGMAIAIIATILNNDVTSYGVLLVIIGVGAAIAAFLVRRVGMTQMPELVAILHSFVGLAAVLVGFTTYLDPKSNYQGPKRTIHDVEIYLGIHIGALTFTGSVIAFGILANL